MAKGDGREGELGKAQCTSDSPAALSSTSESSSIDALPDAAPSNACADAVRCGAIGVRPPAYAGRGEEGMVNHSNGYRPGSRLIQEDAGAISHV